MMLILKRIGTTYQNIEHECMDPYQDHLITLNRLRRVTTNLTWILIASIIEKEQCNKLIYQIRNTNI